MTDAFTALDGLLSGAVNSVFAEQFDFFAFKSSSDVNAPKVSDPSRPTFTAAAIWNAQSKSKAPTARGAVQDDNAHNWTAAHPEVHVDDNLLQWKPQPGDRVRRRKTGQTYTIGVPPRPDGMGHTCLQLTAAQRIS